MKKIPVTVLSGYLGAGKTTVLNYLLTQDHGKKIAVIVNDMSEVNIDAELVEMGGGLVRSEEQLVEMSNGCICCTLREDLLIEVEKLAQKGGIDYIVIESTGISEPIPVAQTFSYIDEELGIDLTKYCTLDTMVTVVDAFRFWHDYRSGDSLLDRKEAVTEEDQREIADLLIDQIEFCDVLILNKCDLVEEKDLQQLEQLLKKLQPSATIIRTVKGAINPDKILATGSFNFDRANQSAGWLKELMNGHQAHTPETEEYGITSFVYHRRFPFHQQRFEQWLNNMPESIVRAKGIIWLASQHNTAILVSQAGPSISADPVSYWVASLPEQKQQEILQQNPALRETWDEEFGDRLTRFVIIGIGLNEQHITKQLDQCLITADEYDRGMIKTHT